MGFSATLFLLPPQNQIKHHPSLPSSLDLNTNHDLLLLVKGRRPSPSPSPSLKRRSIVPVARLFGPAIFEASKLKVLFVGVDEEKHPGKLPRTYTLTHSDITSKLTLAISNTINRAQLQGWYNRLQRDEVVAEWKKVKGKMSLHVHCHISGGHFLHDLIASLRFYIFCRELPVVLKAFVHGDESLFNNYPELEEALVWVYFQSNLPEFNRVECWGPLRDASSVGRRAVKTSDIPEEDASNTGEAAAAAGGGGGGGAWVWPQRCQAECDCCFPPHSLIPWPQDIQEEKRQSAGQPQQ